MDSTNYADQGALLLRRTVTTQGQNAVTASSLPYVQQLDKIVGTTNDLSYTNRILYGNSADN